MSTTAPPIRLLPESVSARIRSTLTITNISDVISELLQNAIDAGANTVAVTVNLGRNSCVLEDDGHGITPDDMLLVGQEYATSKYPPSGDFGFRGQALSAICRHSLATITSRADAHKRTVMRRISYGREIFTGVAPEHLALGRSGTLIRVEGLWGDMPVRVKVREGADVDREWDDVKRGITMVLLSRGGMVGVVVKDENGEVKVRVRGGGGGSGWEVKVLKQVYAVSTDGWEKVVARMGEVGIEGRVCTRGSASKGFQYLYVNGYPVPMGTTLLHAEINRLFAASSFGVVEEDDGTTKLRGNQRKSADRWAMFILRVECHQREMGVVGGEGGTEGKAGLEGDNLNAVIGLLQKLIHEFLKTHYFRPTIGATEKVQRGEGTTVRASSSSALDMSGKSQPRTPLSAIHRSSNIVSSRTKDADKPPRSGDLGLLASWSRVKAARVDPREEEGRQGSGFTKTFTFLPAVPTAKARVTPEKTSQDIVGSPDEFLEWTNPVSLKTFAVNSRTGNTSTVTVRGPPPGRSTDRVGLKRRASGDSFLGRRLVEDDNSSKRARTEPLQERKQPGEFIENLLRNWKNPVFKPTEAPIPQVTLHSSEFVAGGCAHPTTTSPLFETTSTLGKLTKSGLRNAEVISQVDKKYILIKTAGITTSSSPDPSGLLVIVDQHAADERVRVESFFAELCSPNPPARPPEKSITCKVSTREGELFTRHLASFEEWSIRYVVTAGDPGPDKMLTVTSLPSMISDRCASEPSLAIDMLRRHIPVLEEVTPRTTTSTTDSPSPTGDCWAPRMSRCPIGLVDMINSRACRSAIMFNDPLELDECRVLMAKLAACKFPFQCAHGRPSMIPLLDLSGTGAEAGIGKGATFEERVMNRGGGFVSDFKKWVEREEGVGVGVE